MPKRAVTDDPLRTISERFTRASCPSRSGVRLDVFPSRLLVIAHARDEIAHSGGLRFPDDVSEPKAFAVAHPVFATDPGNMPGMGSVDA